MAKVTIELRDNPDGTVTTTLTPTAADLMEKHYNTTQGNTAAESYALFVVNRLRQASAEQGVEGSPFSVDQTGFTKPGLTPGSVPIPGKKRPY